MLNTLNSTVLNGMHYLSEAFFLVNRTNLATVSKRRIILKSNRSIRVVLFEQQKKTGTVARRRRILKKKKETGNDLRFR